jgi:hypothetical protein
MPKVVLSTDDGKPDERGEGGIQRDECQDTPAPQTDTKAVALGPKMPRVPTIEWIVAEMERLGLENEPPTVDWGPDVGSERFYDFE